MDEEMAALDANHTWELVSLPHDKKAIGCKSVYKIKHNANESISGYNARLVANGSWYHCLMIERLLDASRFIR